MDRLRVGLWLFPAAALAWLVVAGGDGDFLVPLLLMAVGWAAAAWATPAWHRVVGALGFVLAAVGVAMFYGFVLWDGLPAFAGLTVAVACLVCAVACGLAQPRALTGGLALMAAGALLWVVSDSGEIEWEVGNGLLLAGALLAASASWPRAVPESA
jgi:hypothetical protein